MERKNIPTALIVKIAAAVIAAFWIITGSFPTGWIYDIKAGKGIKQGQIPDQSVQMIKGQEDVKEFCFGKVPATVTKEDLVQCPLLHLRDERYKGEHKHKVNGGTRSISISEYVHTAYPVDLYTRFYCTFFGSGAYNKYYLAPLDDGSYVCVYFDDYLMMKPSKKLPTGYIRYTASDEKKMLGMMKEDYTVNTDYVLDMYRHGKVNWLIDLPLRMVLVAVLLWVYSAVEKKIKKIKLNRSQKADI